MRDPSPYPSPDSHAGDMTPAEFRDAGHRLVDWIADYMEHPERYPVLARTAPGETRRRLPAHPPEQPEPLDTILADFEKIIVPGVTHWNHPAFFAYFSITGSGPGVLGELLSAALNVNAMLWKTCPAASELEEVVLGWLREMIGLPAGFAGVVMDTASVASLVAIAVARERVEGIGAREEGLAGRPDVPRLRLYMSEQSHMSIEKAAITLGIGLKGVRKIPVDDAFRLRPEALEAAIAEDRAAGWRPFCVVATVGTTSTTSIDPVDAMADICAAQGLWLHVDAAYAGSAAVLPEHRGILSGCERADSFVFNPHKWLFTPFDFSAFYTRHPEAVRAAFSLVPEYLQTPEDPEARNYMDYGVQLGRRFRALKMWFVLRYFGRSGIVARLRQHIAWAREVAGWIDADPGFERLAPVPFSVVCFRARPAELEARLAGADPARREEIEADLDRLNQTLMDAVNATGEAYLSHTKLHGRMALRLAIGNLRTERRHIERCWALLREEAARAFALMGKSG